VETSLIGDFNVQNILCATTVALELDLPIAAIQRGILSLGGIEGRMERIDRGQSFLALVDFAHSPASLERALQTLRTVSIECAGSGSIEKISERMAGVSYAVFGSAGLTRQGETNFDGTGEWTFG
jgi:UDP-N-acetylmuramyl tripeptide synthase